MAARLEVERQYKMNKVGSTHLRDRFGQFPDVIKSNPTIAVLRKFSRVFDNHKQKCLCLNYKVGIDETLESNVETPTPAEKPANINAVCYVYR
jgi:hypothetical protein